MLKDLREYFKSFKDERVADLDYYVSENHEQIKGALERASDIQHRLMLIIPEALRKDFDTYTDVELELYTLALDIAYEQGLTDGLELARIAAGTHRENPAKQSQEAPQRMV